jgi:hypothetical protein
MNRKWIPILILFVWLSQAGSSSLKNIEYGEIVSGLTKRTGTL